MKQQIDTRQRILEAAVDEFAQHGLAGARVDRIAKLGKVNKAMIYYHYGSKEELYQSVINFHFYRMGNFMEKTLVEEDDVEIVFERISGFYHHVFETSPGFVPILLREIAEGAGRIKTALTKMATEKGLVSKVRALIEKGVREGKFRDLDYRHTVSSFVGMNLFYVMTAPAFNAIWGVDDEKAFKVERPRAIADLFLHGLKVR